MFSWWLPILAIAGIFLLFAWMVSDASFKATCDLFLIVAGIKDDYGMGLRESFVIDSLGLRVVLLTMLLASSSICYFAWVWVSFTSRQGFSLRELMVITTAFCFALTLLCQYHSVAWLGFRIRTLARSGEYISSCKLIFQTWPSKNLSGTPLGSISLQGDHETTSEIHPHREGYTFQDRFGPLMHKLPNRLIVDCSTYPSWKLEYFDDDSEPTSFTIDYNDFLVNHDLLKTEKVRDNLYLVQYEETMISG